MRTYRDTITLPGHMTLDDADAVVEKLREYASADRQGRNVAFTFEADDDWTLHALVDETMRELDANFSIPYAVDKGKVGGDYEGTQLAALAKALRSAGAEVPDIDSADVPDWLVSLSGESQVLLANLAGGVLAALLADGLQLARIADGAVQVPLS